MHFQQQASVHMAENAKILKKNRSKTIRGRITNFQAVCIIKTVFLCFIITIFLFIHVILQVYNSVWMFYFIMCIVGEQKRGKYFRCSKLIFVTYSFYFSLCDELLSNTNLFIHFSVACIMYSISN